MAKIVDEMPGRNRASKFPWEEWFDGNVWMLEPGEDFTSSVEGFRSTAHNAAKNMGYVITTRVKDNVVYLQASLPDEEVAAELAEIEDEPTN